VLVWLDNQNGLELDSLTIGVLTYTSTWAGI
jgi:hypothetical protein